MLWGSVDTIGHLSLPLVYYAQILEFWRNLCCHNSTIYLEIQGVPVALEEILMYLIHKELCWKTWELPWTYSIRFMNRPNLQLLVIIIVVSFWLCWELFIDPNEIQCQFTKIIINCFHNHYHPKDFLFLLYFNIKLWCGSCKRDLHNIYEAMWLRQSHRSHIIWLNQYVKQEVITVLLRK